MTSPASKSLGLSFTSDRAKTDFRMHGKVRSNKAQVPLHPYDNAPSAFLGASDLQTRNACRTSVTCVSFIPTNVLKFPFNAFRDDGVSLQPARLSEAYVDDHFRMIHGIQLDWEILPSGHIVPLDLRLLNESNHTHIRGLGLPFASPIQIAHHSSMELPPGPIAVFAIGSGMRSMNGFMATPFGKMLSVIRASPQIGSLLNLWIAADGCRAIVTVNNHFPDYSYYLDGALVTWAGQPGRKFENFDGFQIELPWRNLIVTSLLAFMDSRSFDLMTAIVNVPVKLPYPAGCTFGWWRSVDSSGNLNSCEDGVPLTSIDFNGTSSLPEWWSSLVRYAQISKALRQNGDEQHLSLAEELERVWERLGARKWKCRRLRRPSGPQTDTEFLPDPPVPPQPPEALPVSSGSSTQAETLRAKFATLISGADTLKKLKDFVSYEHWPERFVALREIARNWKHDPSTSAWLRLMVRSENPDVRHKAMLELVEGWKQDVDTLNIVKELASFDLHPVVRRTAVRRLLIDWKEDPNTLNIIKERASSDRHEAVRLTALGALACEWMGDSDTLGILRECAASDSDSDVRHAATASLAHGYDRLDYLIPDLKRLEDWENPEGFPIAFGDTLNKAFQLIVDTLSESDKINEE